MGRLRSLTVDEILVQVYYAFKVVRVANEFHLRSLPNVNNIVFMVRWLELK